VGIEGTRNEGEKRKDEMGVGRQSVHEAEVRARHKVVTRVKSEKGKKDRRSRSEN
jgi:hypothetical protein